MKNIFLCTAGDFNYFKNNIFNLCLKSYSKDTKMKKIVFLVEDEDKDVDTYGLEKIIIPWKNIKSKNSNRCIQHGEFARFMEDCEDDDRIIFTDGDIVMQRDITEEEQTMILNLKEKTFLANYNMHYKSDMNRVIYHVGADVKKLIFFIENNFNISIEELKKYKEMNTGVLIARKKDFLELSKIYGELYPELSSIISGFWNQQFLINLIVNKFFSYEDLPYNFHTHTHHSIKTKDGCVYDIHNQMGVPSPVVLLDNKFIINNSIILFAHKFH